MMRHRLVAALGAAALWAAALAPMEARAQFGGYGGLIGNVIGGAVAGSIIANSQPRVVYLRSRGASGRSRAAYARPRFVYARPRVVYARPVPHRVATRGAVPVSSPAATINAGADPFATAQRGGLIPVAAKP